MPDAQPAPAFTWSADEIRRVGYEVVDLIADHLSALPDAPVFQPVPAELAASLLAEPVPQHGEPVDAVLARFAREVAPYPFGNGHPRFAAWVNPPPAIMGVFGAALAAAMNPSVAGGNHAAVWIEHQVLGWVRSLLGFPPEAAGLLVSGGSAAAITALTVARHVACARHGWDVRARGVPPMLDGRPARLLVYRSTEAHGCNQKAVELLGLGANALRDVPMDAALRLRPDALDAMLTADRASGHVPMAVVASAGTVNTGAIDPLDAIADVCARHGVWLHVDGAYGAPAALIDEYRAPLAALGRVDSLAVDAHKWLYVPVDAGMVLVRDAAAMRNAFSLVPPYLRTDGPTHGVQGPPWFSEFGTEQSRPFRALKLWMAIRYFGVEGYRTLVAQDVALARHWADLVRADPAFELWEPQEMSILCFRAVPPTLAADAHAIDALNAAVLRTLQLGGVGFLSGTMLGGRTWLRACLVNPRTTEADVALVMTAIREAVVAALDHAEPAVPVG